MITQHPSFAEARAEFKRRNAALLRPLPNGGLVFDHLIETLNHPTTPLRHKEVR